MFRRKEDSLFDTATDSGQESATVINSSAPQQPQHSPAPAPAYSAASPAAPAARPAPTAPTSSFRPSTPAPATADLSRNRMPEAKPAATMMAGPSSADKANKSGKRVLTVGNDILLKGEIATCDRLVIEGKVDATLNDVHTVEIAENGSFKGSANIEDAEISGLFEGDLVVRNRLVIYATGKVRGKITYGEVEIERGGELSGEIKTSTAQSSQSAPRPPRQAVKQDDKVAA